MVFEIRIRLLNKLEEVLVEYKAGNLQNFDTALTMPTQTFGLPEDYFEKAILTKSEGNTAKTVFSWVIMDEQTTPWSVMTKWADLWPSSATENDPIPHQQNSTTTIYSSRKIKIDDGSNIEGGASYVAYDAKTADGQIVALGELFEKRGFTGEDKHQIILRDATNNFSIYSQKGLINRISFQKAGTDPVTWNASIELTIGEVVDATA